MLQTNSLLTLPTNAQALSRSMAKPQAHIQHVAQAYEVNLTVYCTKNILFDDSCCVNAFTATSSYPVNTLRIYNILGIILLSMPFSYHSLIEYRCLFLFYNFLRSSKLTTSVLFFQKLAKNPFHALTKYVCASHNIVDTLRFLNPIIHSVHHHRDSSQFAQTDAHLVDKFSEQNVNTTMVRTSTKPRGYAPRSSTSQ